LERYLAEQEQADAPVAVRERSAPYIGAVRLDARKLAADHTARMIRQRNWRE
jgi:hypothetical protein